MADPGQPPSDGQVRGDLSRIYAPLLTAIGFVLHLPLHWPMLNALLDGETIRFHGKWVFFVTFPVMLALIEVGAAAIWLILRRRSWERFVILVLLIIVGTLLAFPVSMIISHLLRSRFILG